MFRLHETTQRRICQAAFVLLCALPTVLVAGWCVAWRLPGHRTAEMRQLSDRLGLSATCAGMQHLRPGAVLYEGLELADPETGQVVFRCRLLEAAWTEVADADGQARTALVLSASQPELEVRSLDCGWQFVERILQSQAGWPEIEVRWTAGEMTLRAGDASETLTDCAAAVAGMPGGAQARALFRVAGADAAEPMRVRVLRNRQLSPPANGVDLDTGGGQLPCGWLGTALPELQRLGPAARFCGHLWANRTAAGWEGDLTGRLLGLDLGTLVSDQFPHKLGGQADATLQSARFRNGRLEQAAGSLRAGPGVVGRSLLDAAVRHLHCARPEEVRTRDELLPYDCLALDFEIGAEGLRLRGGCPSSSGMILSAGGMRLLGEPAAQPQPVVALIQMLVPASEVQVPATRQSDWLSRHLPVPDVVPSRDASTAVPHVGLRLGGTVPK